MRAAPRHGRIRPALSLRDVYGPGHTLVSRAHPRACRWLPPGPLTLDRMSVAVMAIMGDMRLICSAGGATPAGLCVLEEAGLEIAATFDAFRTVAELEERVRARVGAGDRLIAHHWLPDGLIPPAAYLVPPAVLAHLNNKATLPALVPPAHQPERRVEPAGALPQLMRARRRWPCVVKAAVHESTGGGLDVVVCRTPADIARASQHFTGVETVIVEEYLDIEQNLCLNYAVAADGTIHYLGAAEQIVDDHGRFHGNWLDLDLVAPAPAVEVGRHVAAAGAALGYYGCVWIDMAVLPGGHVVAYDLNFRYNASTPPLLLFDAVCRQLGCRVARAGSLEAAGMPELAAAVCTAVRQGFLFPMAVFDAAAAGHAGARPSVFSLVLGGSRAEVAAREGALSALGLA